MPELREVVARKQEEMNCELAEPQKLTKSVKSHQKSKHKIGNFVREIIHCIKDIKGYKGQIQEMKPRLKEIKIELKGIREKTIATTGKGDPTHTKLESTRKKTETMKRDK